MCYFLCRINYLSLCVVFSLSYLVLVVKYFILVFARAFHRAVKKKLKHFEGLHRLRFVSFRFR